MKTTHKLTYKYKKLLIIKAAIIAIIPLLDYSQKRGKKKIKCVCPDGWWRDKKTLSLSVCEVNTEETPQADI